MLYHWHSACDGAFGQQTNRFSNQLNNAYKTDALTSRASLLICQPHLFFFLSLLRLIFPAIPILDVIPIHGTDIALKDH